MKNKTSLFFLLGLVFISMLTNSCKKDTAGSIDKLFTGGNWQLSSATATVYLGDAITSTTTLYATCTYTQFFTFKEDNTCTYTNFNCLPQTSNGKWALSPDKLILNADMTCDTASAASTKPFINARIVTLGQYSMVLETNDNPVYSATKPRRVVRYGFVRQKSTI